MDILKMLPSNFQFELYSYLHSMQKQFAEQVVTIVKDDPTVIGLAAAGSWITGELDEYSDLDLVLVTTGKLSGNLQLMLAMANRFGTLLSAFTGEHVGEPRLLICLYDAPLIHVDIKFLTLSEFNDRVEDPTILYERDGKLSSVINEFPPAWSFPGYQWIEDRFWTWVHYIATKVGRGEYFECLDALTFLRSQVLAPLLQVRYGQKPRGLRKIEKILSTDDKGFLEMTVAGYDKQEIIRALENSILLYQLLRKELFPSTTCFQLQAENKSLEYFYNLLKAG